MSEANSYIQLSPWISVPKGSKTSQISQLTIKKLQSKEVILITILSIKPQNLSLIGKFTFSCEDNNNSQTLAFISPVIYQRELPFQIAFIPYRQGKLQYECIQGIAQILKAVSEIVITDVNCNGYHKYKQKGLSKFDEAKQFVIVNNKDVYQIEVKQNKIELSKAAQFSIGGTQTWTMPQLNATPKFANYGLISTIFLQYFQQFVWFLNSEKNWRCLADMALSRYRSQMHLIECFDLDNEGKQRKIRTVQQMKTIENEIMSYARDDRDTMTEQIASIMVAKIQKQNNCIDILLALKQNFSEREVQNQSQFNLLLQEASKSLNEYQISEQFITFLTSSHHQSLLQKEITNLREKQQILKELVMQRNNQLMIKSHKIDQLKQMLQQFAQKAEQMKRNTQQLIDVTQLYEQEKQKNWKLQIEVDSHIFISKKCADAQLVLQSQMQSLMKDKAELLMALQELTSQNLSLMNQRESLNQQTSDLRERISDSNQVQARALKSIQNEAQIKVRLNRYENYVGELKQVFNSFKRLQIQKFNYILQHNYKQYCEIEQKLKFSQFELRRGQLRVKELTQSLHCERVKLSYFQRIYASSYQNDVILQVSEENSATDREVSQNA